MRELDGKRALVTGGTKGIGKAVVAWLRAAGATVLTTAREGSGEVFIAADLTTAEGCARVAKGRRRSGPADPRRGRIVGAGGRLLRPR